MKIRSKCLGSAILMAVIQIVAVVGIEVREPENEKEMSSLPPSPTSAAIVSSPADVPFSTEPADNGMAVAEAPQIDTTPVQKINPSMEFDAISKTYLPKIPPTVDVAFPENHSKNFTGSPYLGAIETPPHLYTKYQQQYRDFYVQKNNFAATAKPIKFEENSANNRYAGNGLSAYGEEANTASQELHPRHKPYPYLFGDGNAEDQIEQPAYPIPNNNLLENENEETSEVKPTGSGLFPSFANFGSSLSGFFGGGPKTTVQHVVSHQVQGQRSEIAHKTKPNGSWKKIVKVLSTVVPFGLFLATLTPNLLYINSTEDNKPSRARSMELENRRVGGLDPLVELVEKLGGLEAMENAQCEDRFFCEMSVLGKDKQSNFVERGFWYLANEVPDDVAEEVGMRELFKAIRTNSCNMYDCKPKEKENGIEKRSDIEDKQSKSTEPLKKAVNKKPTKVKKFIRN